MPMTIEQNNEFSKRLDEAETNVPKHLMALKVASAGGLPVKMVAPFLSKDVTLAMETLAFSRFNQLKSIGYDFDNITKETIDEVREDYKLKERTELNNLNPDLYEDKALKFGKTMEKGLSKIPGLKGASKKAKEISSNALGSTQVQNASLLLQVRIRTIFRELNSDLEWLSKVKGFS